MWCGGGCSGLVLFLVGVLSLLPSYKVLLISMGKIHSNVLIFTQVIITANLSSMLQ